MPTFDNTRLVAQAQRLRAKKVGSSQFMQALPTQVEGRRADITDNLDNWGSEHVVKGQVLLRGSGEATITVPFHRYYIEIPNFSFGSALREDAVVTAGNFPELNATVGSWSYYRPDLDLLGINMREYYIGATILIVCTGPIDLDRYFHYHFSGKSLTNPASRPLDLGTLDTTSLTTVIT